MSITNEHLDEIEKLAEAATPGPWKTVVDEFHADSGAHQVALHDCFNEQDAEKNAALIAAMREYALPLVKAVREARRERDKYKSALDAELPAAWREDIESLNSCLERIGKERNEARAKVERLKDELATSESVRMKFCASSEKLRKEVERLRGLLKTVWEDACNQEVGFLDEVCDAVEAALKEGDR